PGGILNALATILHGSIHATSSIHRLQLGLLGYLIPFATLAFVSYKVPSPSVVLPISTHFTAPLEIPFTPTILKSNSFYYSFEVKLQDLIIDLLNHLQTLYAQ
ncbi:unnamed protein product, partial [Ectocarpus fasciculatus]